MLIKNISLFFGTEIWGDFSSKTWQYFLDDSVVSTKDFAGGKPLMICCISYMMPTWDHPHVSFYKVTVLSSGNTLYPTLFHFMRLVGPIVNHGLPRWLSGKNLPAKAGDPKDTGSILGSGSYLGEGNGNSLQYSCLENPMDREGWRAAVHRVAKNQTQLGTHELLTTLSVSYWGTQGIFHPNSPL